VKMSVDTPSLCDPSLARGLSRLLLGGLILAIALLLAGVVLTVVRPEIPVPTRTSLVDLPRALVALEPGGFFGLGLLVLLATPAARVAALVVAFARRRLWVFCGVAVVVLAVLAAAGYVGLRAG
jgi:uncharacterized membrane protein